MVDIANGCYTGQEGGKGQKRYDPWNSTGNVTLFVYCIDGSCFNLSDF